MPKLTNTRKQRAAELLRMLRKGPDFGEPFDGKPYTAAERSNQYRVWSDAWILDELTALVPELRGIDPRERK